MKKIFMAALLLLAMMMIGCGGDNKTTAEPEKKDAVQTSPTNSAQGNKILVVYFTRPGEEYSIGRITKGNTEIIAEMIAQKTDADLFKIEAATPYPIEYEPCKDIAKQELESNARPAIVGNVDNLAQYGTIFVGYPIWWGALPRIVLTFLESNDFSGKKIIPFCTHGGSSAAGTEHEIKEACPDAKVLSVLAISGKVAQTDSATAQKTVDTWLKDLGY